MKKLLLYIILFSYSIIMFKPVMPYVQDFVGHALFYSQHMAEVHFENGKYHLHAEVVKNAEEQNNAEEKLPSSNKKNQTQSEHIIIAAAKQDMFGEVINKEFSKSITPDIEDGVFHHNYPPPRF